MGDEPAIRDMTIYVHPFLSNAQYTFGTGMEVWEAMSCIAVAEERCWNGPYFTQMPRVRKRTEET